MEALKQQLVTKDAQLATQAATYNRMLQRMLNSSLLSSNSRHSPPNLQPNTLRPRWSLLRPPHLALRSRKVFCFRLLFSTTLFSPFFLLLQPQPQLLTVVIIAKSATNLRVSLVQRVQRMGNLTPIFCGNSRRDRCR